MPVKPLTNWPMVHSVQRKPGQHGRLWTGCDCALAFRNRLILTTNRARPGYHRDAGMPRFFPGCMLAVTSDSAGKGLPYKPPEVRR